MIRRRETSRRSRRTLLVVALATALVAGIAVAVVLPDRGPRSLHVAKNLVKAGGDRYVVKAVTVYILPFYRGGEGGVDSALADTTKRMYDDRDAVFARMASLGVNTVRVPLQSTMFSGDDPYGIGGGEGLTDRAVKVVEAARAAGLRTVFCWWDALNQGEEFGSRYAEAFPSMQQVAAAVGSHPDVTYEPWNEPHSIDQAAWVTAMTATLKLYRQTIGYRGVLWLDTTGYSWEFDADSARAMQQVDAGLLGGSSQLVFANHRYAQRNTCFCGEELANWQRQIGSHVGAFPIVGMEYGYWNDLGPPQPTWNRELTEHLRDVAVPAGLNGYGAFVWNWVDPNTMTGDDGQLLEHGRIAVDGFFRRVA